MTNYLDQWLRLREGNWVTMYKTPIGWGDTDRSAGRPLDAQGRYLVTEVDATYVRVKWGPEQSGPGDMKVKGSDIEIGADDISSAENA